MIGSKRAVRVRQAAAVLVVLLASVVVTVHVAPPAVAAVTLAPPTLPDTTIGSPYSVTITASGGSGSYLFSVVAGALPPGLGLASDGTLSGIPSASGSFNFTVAAEDDSTVEIGSRAYTITVAPAPTITIAPSSLPGGTSGTAYSQSLTASGGEAPHSFAVTAGALPAGVSLSALGQLSGTPTASGIFNFTVTATDSSTGAGPFSGSRAYSLTVAAPTITIAPGSLPGATAGVPYSQALSASGGVAPHSFAVTAGALPAGVSLSALGQLSGTPTASGIFNFTVTATDSTTGGGPFSGSRAYTLTVAAPTIAISPPSLPGATAGTSYAQTITAAGGTTPHSFSLTAGALPPGMSFSSGGQLSGIPTATGTFNFTVTATDASTGSGPFTGSRSYSLAVAAPLLTVTPSALPAATFGASYSQALVADEGTPPYSFAVTGGSLPAGLTLSAGGVLSGTPTVDGAFTFTVTATDAGSFGATGSRAYELAVQAPPFSLTASPTSVVAGGQVQVQGSGLVPGSTVAVELRSDPIALGNAPTTGGTFAFTAVVPAGTTPGQHTIVATATTPGGAVLSQQVTLTVAAPVGVPTTTTTAPIGSPTTTTTAPRPPLPRTGDDALPLLGTAALLLGVGLFARSASEAQRPRPKHAAR
jgi:hypothetical protein